MHHDLLTEGGPGLTCGGGGGEDRGLADSAGARDADRQTPGPSVQGRSGQWLREADMRAQSVDPSPSQASSAPALALPVPFLCASLPSPAALERGKEEGSALLPIWDKGTSPTQLPATRASSVRVKLALDKARAGECSAGLGCCVDGLTGASLWEVHGQTSTRMGP